jgi:branched-chain amino acid transport system substrate-binding protein
MSRLRGSVLATALLALGAGVAHAEIPNHLLKVGVLTDMSGPFAQQAGEGSVVAAKMAAEDFAKEAGDLKVEIVSADHQNKPDIGSSIVRRWIDQDGVTAVVDLPNSSVGLAISGLMNEKNRTTMASGSATSDMTGKFCKNTTVQWALDTWALGNANGRAVTKAGGKDWYFISFDYALGQALERDTVEAVKKSGGRVVGSVHHPLGTTDFSSYLLQAQASGAKVIAFLGAGTDFVNAVKQAQEFGVMKSGKRFVGLTGYINSVMALGLPTAQGLTQTETFYWDLNPRTRAFMDRVRGQLPADTFPCHNHAGDYAGLLHYLKAAAQIGVAKAKASGRETVAAMKAMPTDDDAFGAGTIRKDGRKLHPTYLFLVKTPAESRGPGDVYKVLAETSAEQSFRPIADGACAMAKA